MLRVVTPERKDSSSMVRDSEGAFIGARIIEKRLDMPQKYVTPFDVTILLRLPNDLPGNRPRRRPVAGQATRHPFRPQPGRHEPLAPDGSACDSHHEFAVAVLP